MACAKQKKLPQVHFSVKNLAATKITVQELDKRYNRHIYSPPETTNMKTKIILHEISLLTEGTVPVTRDYTGSKLRVSFLPNVQFDVQPNGTVEIEYGNDIASDNTVIVSLKAAEGNILTTQEFPGTNFIGKPEVQITFSSGSVMLERTQQDAGPELSIVNGRLLELHGKGKMNDVQLIFYTSTIESPELFIPVATIVTEAGGYFILPYPKGKFREAYVVPGIETVESKYFISLVSDGEGNFSFPSRLIIVVETGNDAQNEKHEQDCGCEALGNFHEQKRILEEFSYCSIIRTSDPEIKAYTVEEQDEISLADFIQTAPGFGKDILKDIKVNPDKLPLMENFEQGTSGEPPAVLGASGLVIARGAVASDTEDDLNEIKKKISSVKIRKSVALEFINRNGAVTAKNYQQLIAKQEEAKQRDVLNPAAISSGGRMELDTQHTVDWDETPTQYLATSIAYGHILHYKQQWIADGYSMGDLVYSLPLAPGQKKQIAVIDFDRNERAINSQRTDYRESLENSLSRDRDINEIANGILSESMDGTSTANVATGGGGIGGALGPIVFGVAGGYSRASSTASQNSMRSTSANNLQSLTDRTVQSASAVRSQRSTVVQSVSQDETMQVTTESVANYNHCHAITIQYFEVLRHFKVQHRLTDVQESLFIPLPISPFDIEKARRWREPLARTIRDRSLRTSFDALQRVQDRWENSNIPNTTVADEQILNLAGNLKLSFNFSRPADKLVPVEVDGVTTNVPEFEPSNWSWMGVLLGKDPAQFHQQYIKDTSAKDEAFHKQLGLLIARAIVNRLEVRLVDKDGNESATLNTDASIGSGYLQGKPMSVSLRFSPPINHKRKDILYIKISIKSGTALPSFCNVIIHSGSMIYNTEHYSGALFNYGNISNDLMEGDSAMIFTPLSQNELRNPRKDDIDLVNRLIHHLNSNLEYYHKMLFLMMTPERRFMLLDGIKIKVPGEKPTDPQEWRSVASVVINKLLAVVGNSMVFPVVPGLNLNPEFRLKADEQTGEMIPLLDYYQHEPMDPMHISVPTKGVFAEAMMGKCNSCEVIDEKRFWRWEQSPIPDSPTAINPVSLDSRRADPGNLQPAPLANPVVNIQNAPAAPDPSGIGGVLELLGKGDSFRDLTGLTQNQQNAIEGLKQSMSTAQSFGAMGLDLRKAQMQQDMQKERLRTMKDLYEKGKINKEDMDKELKDANKDPELTNVIDRNNAAKNGDITTEQRDALNPPTPQQKLDSLKSNLSSIQEAVQNGTITKSTGTSIAEELMKSSMSGGSDEVVSRVKEMASEFQGSISSIKTGADGAVEIKGDMLSVAKNPTIDIETVNSTDSLTFDQRYHSLHGTTILHAYVYPEVKAKVKSFNWINLNEDKINLINKSATSVTVQGLKPGICEVLFEIRDAEGQVIDYKRIPLSVPQYYRLFESSDYTASADRVPPGATAPNTFNGVLAYAGLLDSRVEIYRKAKGIAEELLREVNVRIAWEMMDETVPSFVKPEDICTISIGGFTDFVGAIGYTAGTDPVDSNNERIMVTIGAITDYLSEERIAEPLDERQRPLQTIVQIMRNEGISIETRNALRPLWLEIFSRTFGFVIAHETGHSILALRGHHTSEFDPDDMMGAGFDVLDIGLVITDMAQWPFEGSYEWRALKGFNQNNLNKIKDYLPVGADAPYNSFYEMTFVQP